MYHTNILFLDNCMFRNYLLNRLNYSLLAYIEKNIGTVAYRYDVIQFNNRLEGK